ncbi:MAG: hypothetical protein D6763_02910 [Alphaproteobacteria bacterium]|nr:MAG: hypothetical protein D6763_02910 [Alphaproteobacteria bacterium]
MVLYIQLYRDPSWYGVVLLRSPSNLLWKNVVATIQSAAAPHIFVPRFDRDEVFLAGPLREEISTRMIVSNRIQILDCVEAGILEQLRRPSLA